MKTALLSFLATTRCSVSWHTPRLHCHSRCRSWRLMAAHTEASSSQSPYHIEEGPTHTKVPELASKHVKFRDAWSSHYAAPRHTVEALSEAKTFVSLFYSKHGSEGSGALKVILDSGCGTGRSSALIAAANPDLPVIGLDRSINRLSKNPLYASSTRESAATDPPPNLLLLRCDVVGFWYLAATTLVAQDQWHISQHTIFYPNPYPKAKQLKYRWHGHAVFPYLLQVPSTMGKRKLRQPKAFHTFAIWGLLYSLTKPSPLFSGPAQCGYYTPEG